MRFKVTLEDVVYVLDEPTVKTFRMAKQSPNPDLVADYMLKDCLVSVNGKDLKPAEKEKAMAEMPLAHFTNLQMVLGERTEEVKKSQKIERIF